MKTVLGLGWSLVARGLPLDGSEWFDGAGKLLWERQQVRTLLENGEGGIFQKAAIVRHQLGDCVMHGTGGVIATPLRAERARRANALVAEYAHNIQQADLSRCFTQSVSAARPLLARHQTDA